MTDDDNGVWYDDQGRPHITVAPNAPIGPNQSGTNQLPTELPVEQFEPSTPITPGPINKLYDIMTGGNGQERYQLFPERIVRSALSLPTDVMSGKVQTPVVSPSVPIEDNSQDELLQRVQDMAALMGGGGIGMAEKGTLGSVGGKLVQPATDTAIAPVFHSAVENAVNTASLKSAPAQQWLSTISNAKGVKPEELDWTGLKDFLSEQNGPVSKEQIQQHLEGNKVELKEVNKGSAKPHKFGTPEEQAAILKRYEDAKQAISTGKIGTSEYQNAIVEWNNVQRDIKDIVPGWGRAEGSWDGDTKYSKYQLPGGENYREKLLTLPKKEAANGETMNDFAKRLAKESGDDWENLGPNGRQQYQNQAVQLETAAQGNYKSSHWDEPNVLAHIRMNDRTIEGKKALHIEEIQSDWHQQGREQGYKLTPEQKKKLDEIDYNLTSGLSEKDIGNPDMDAMLKTAVDKKVVTPQEASNYKQWSKGENSNIPDAPFKKTWLELAAKRMIREAAEQGKDVLSWTPGEAQAARYDLSKQIKEISHIKNPKTVESGYKGEDTYDVAATTHTGGDVNIPNAGKMTERDLENTFGKEIAKKIVNNEGNSYRGRQFKTLEGLDLKVGGEGMHYFYDKMLPSVLEKLTGQKMKVGNVPKDIRDYRIEAGPASDRNGNTVTIYSVRDNQNRLLSDFKSEADAKQYIEGRKAGEAEQKAPRINYIDLPQSVKDTALHKGFPLFSSGLMLTPTDENPFAKSKYRLIPVKHNPFEEKK